jgi:hypothetical protein
MYATMMLHCGCYVSRLSDLIRNTGFCEYHRRKYFSIDKTIKEMADDIYSLNGDDIKEAKEAMSDEGWW